MNKHERNNLIVEYTPKIDRLINNLRIDVNNVEDARQAGIVALIEEIDAFAAQNPAAPIEDFHRTSNYLERRLARAMRNEDRTLKGETVEDLDTVVAEEREPVVNDDNEDIDSEAQRERLLKAIMNLTDKRARQLMLGVLSGYTVTEIGEQLGMTQSAADRLYQRTVVLIRERVTV